MSRIPPEFPRPFEVAALSRAPVRVTISATAEECAALARRFDLGGVAGLSATFELTASPAGGARVTGSVRAEVEQTCVVTLEPVVNHVTAAVERHYGEDPAADAGPEVDIDAEGDDPPDPIVEGRIDLGELAAEELSLAIDPFPRAPGAVFEGCGAEGDDDDAPAGPFAGLATLRGRPRQ